MNPADTVFKPNFEDGLVPEDLLEVYDGLRGGLSCNKTFPYSGKQHAFKFHQDASVDIGGVR